MHNRFFLVDDAIAPDGLRAVGPIIQVEVAVSAALARTLAETGQPIPQPQVVEALIDTGASITAVDLSILQTFGLQPVGQTTVATPSDPSAQAALFAARLAFPGANIPVRAENVVVLGSTLSNQGIGALLGRDFLLNAVLIYNGRGGFYTLAC